MSRNINGYRFFDVNTKIEFEISCFLDRYHIFQRKNMKKSSFKSMAVGTGGGGGRGGGGLAPPLFRDVKKNSTVKMH